MHSGYGAAKSAQSWPAKVRALTRVAHPDCEEELLELACVMTASQLDRALRAEDAHHAEREEHHHQAGGASDAVVPEVEVADDGVGGADPQRGSGLRGLTDRIEALDGTLDVQSLPGEGTTLRAEIPVA